MDNWTDKISAVLKGPGWFPGTERLGDPMGVPEVRMTLIFKTIYEGRPLLLSLSDTTPGEI